MPRTATREKAAPSPAHYEVTPNTMLVRDDGRIAPPSAVVPGPRWRTETRGWFIKDTTSGADLSGIVSFSTTWQAHEFVTLVNKAV